MGFKVYYLSLAVSVLLVSHISYRGKYKWLAYSSALWKWVDFTSDLINLITHLITAARYM